MKKILSLVVLLVGVISLAGCSSPEDLQSIIDDNAANISTLTADLATAQADLATAQADLDTAEASLATAQADLDTAEATLATLQADLDTAEAALTAAEAVGAANTTALADAVTNLEGQIDAVETDIVAIEAEITAIETSITAIEANITAIEANITTIEADVAANETAITANETAITANAEAIEALEAKYSDGTYTPGTYVGTWVQTEDVDGVETDVTYYAIVAVDRNGHYAGAYVDATWYVHLEDETNVVGYTIDTMTISNATDTSYYNYSIMAGDVTGTLFWTVKVGFFGAGFAQNHDFDAPSGIYDYTDSDSDTTINAGDVFEKEVSFMNGVNTLDESTNTVTITMTSATTATVDYLVNYVDGAASGTYLEGTADATDITVSPVYFTWYEARLASTEEVTLTDQDAIDNAIADALSQAEITDPNYEIIYDANIGDYVPGTYVFDFDESAYYVVSGFDSKYTSEDYQYEGKLVVIIDENGNVAGAKAFMFTPLAHAKASLIYITDLAQELVYDSTNDAYDVPNYIDTEYEQTIADTYSFTDNAGKIDGTAEVPVDYEGQEYYIIYSYETTSKSPDGNLYTLHSYAASYIKVGDDYVSSYSKFGYDSATGEYIYYRWLSVPTLGPDGLPDTGDEGTEFQWVEQTVEDGTNFKHFVSATPKTTTDTFTKMPLHFDYFEKLNLYIYEVVESHGEDFTTADSNSALVAFWLYVESEITAD